jgi:hypothetical protein
LAIQVQVGRGKPNERLAPHEVPVRVAHATFEEDEVKLAGVEPLVHRFAQTHGEFQLNAGMVSSEAAKRLGQASQHDIFRYPKSNAAVEIIVCEMP